MKVSVFDTYVRKTNGDLMHFDILVPTHIEQPKVLDYGTSYLESKGLQGVALTTRECRFCHLEQVTTEVAAHINEQGYFIVELENC